MHPVELLAAASEIPDVFRLDLAIALPAEARAQRAETTDVRAGLAAPSAGIAPLASRGGYGHCEPR